MANFPINPYGQNATMPEGYPMANDLNTNSAQQALTAAMGKKLAAMTHKNTIFVVASDASDEDKLAADYQCTGTNDELVIQQAVNAIYAKGGGTLLLSSGTFNIDSFPNHDNNDDGGSETAILIPSNNTTGYEIRIIGDMVPYGSTGGRGTRIVVTDSCYSSLDSSKKYKIFRSTYSVKLIDTAKVSLFMMNMGIRLPWNQKKIMCIDLLYCNRVNLQYILCSGYRSGYNGQTVSILNPPPAAVEDCVGIRMTSGSNYGTICDYKNICCAGFYEGFKVGGEHVIGINLSGIFNVYSYTFGNYPWSMYFLHPITLINCCDERSVNYPLFASCGYTQGGSHDSRGGQQITLIDFNIERIESATPGGQLGELASESVPGTFHGEVSYTIHYGVNGVNVSDKKFWKDGHGQRFISRNSAHLLAGGSTERRSYAPNYLQRYWDTTVGKELVCTDTANKTWRDTAGNVVS